MIQLIRVFTVSGLVRSPQSDLKVKRHVPSAAPLNQTLALSISQFSIWAAAQFLLCSLN